MIKTTVEKNPPPTPKEAARNMSICFKDGIRILPVPYGTRYKIQVEQEGKNPILPDNLYPEKSTKTEIGVFDKIQELYAELANRVEKKNTVTDAHLGTLRNQESLASVNY